MRNVRRILGGLVFTVWAASGADATLFNVAVNSFSFSPNNLTIIQGDQVRWFYNSGTSHTTTHLPSAGQSQLWDEPITSSPSTDEYTFTFNVPGVYNYECTPHGFDGRVTVQAVSGILDDPSNATPSATSVMSQNSPNPFNAATQIEYSLDRDGAVELSVYNILGQEIATLLSGFQPGGRNTATWDGRDMHGNAAPSGIYFARLITPFAVMTRKMVLLR